MAASIQLAEVKRPDPRPMGNDTQLDVKEEDKETKIATVDAKYDAKNFYYTSKLSFETLKSYLKKTKLFSTKELEDFFYENRWIRRGYEWRATASNWTNPLWVLFVVKNAPKGIVDLIHFFNPAFEVNYDDATSAGWTVAIATTIFWMSLFVPETAALESTVDFVTRTPVKQRLTEWYQRSQENHWKGFKESVEFVVSRGILYAVNLNSGVTVALGTAAWYAGFSTSGLIGMAIFFGYMSGVAFFHHISDKDFYRFIRHMKKDISWTLSEIFRKRSFPFWIKEFARQIKIFSQFLAVDFIRSFIQHFAIAKDANEFTRRNWFDPWFMASITAIHSGFLYLSTYKHYLSNALKINKIILNRFSHELFSKIKIEMIMSLGQVTKELKRLIPALKPNQIYEILKKIFPHVDNYVGEIIGATHSTGSNPKWMSDKVDEVLQVFLVEKKEALFHQMQTELNLNWGYEIKRDPISLFMFSFWLGMGSFTAWRFAVPALINVMGEGAAYALSFAGLALLPPAISAASDKARIDDELLAEYLQGERNQKPSLWVRLGMATVLLAAFFVFANAGSGITSQVGMMSDIFEAFTSLAIILILDKEVNSGMYYIGKAAETLSERFTDIKTRCQRWREGSAADAKVYPANPVVLFPSAAAVSVDINASGAKDVKHELDDTTKPVSTKRFGVNF